MQFLEYRHNVPKGFMIYDMISVLAFHHDHALTLALRIPKSTSA